MVYIITLLLLFMCLTNVKSFRLQQLVYDDVLIPSFDINDNSISPELLKSSEELSIFPKNLIEHSDKKDANLEKREQIAKNFLKINRRDLKIQQVGGEDEILEDFIVAETHIFRPVFRYKLRSLEKRKL